MAGINKAIILGRVGKDPEARSMSNGGEVVSFSVATSETWNDKQGTRQEKAEWHNVVIFNENLGRIAKQYLRKGSEVYVEGQIQTRKWQDNNGNDRYSTEIVLQKFRGEIALIGGRAEGGQSTGSYAARSTPRRDMSDGAADYERLSGGLDADLDDDVPF